MTIQPQQPAATARPGWYPHPVEAPNTMRWWDGRAWTANVQPLPVRAPQPVLVHAYAAGGAGRHVSGLTTGQHIFWGILTVCTLGLAAPLWALAAFLGRRRIS
jgi:hypothetical protein